MTLLYITKCQFKEINNKIYSLPAYGNQFWEKYLDVFDDIKILAEEVKGYLNNGTLTEITDKRITVEILPGNTSPKDFINDRIIRKELKKKIEAADAILIKPTSRKGMMAIRIAEQYRKPYMIELTGDLNLTLRNSRNLLRQIYNPILHKQIICAIKNCEYGLYVTQEHLQKVYPIKGKQCGCTDTILPYISEKTLEKRLDKIENTDINDIIKIGMVASYHDNRKGLDTAINSLPYIKNKQVELHILGVGTEEDRSKWFDYAKKQGVEHRLFFDKPLSTVEDVLLWNDSMDLCILPSRSEGLPRCVVESISRACPNIISDVCGLPELVDKHWVHNPNDFCRLAALINELLSSKELMKQVATQNFEHAKDYDADILRNRRNAFLSEFKEYCAKVNTEKEQ